MGLRFVRELTGGRGAEWIEPSGRYCFLSRLPVFPARCLGKTERRPVVPVSRFVSPGCPVAEMM